MPFQIIRADITRVRADAIVNTANPMPRYARGTDAAIYRAAGARALLAQRKKIGRIAPGQVAVTDAFRLPAKYIIHTVGPVWIDGRHWEYDVLRACYRNALLLAEQLGCESIAFPLIAAGNDGFPKDQALEIALSVIREHLQRSDLDVILVVFEGAAYQIAIGLTELVEAYIDENYVAQQEAQEYGDSTLLSEHYTRLDRPESERDVWEKPMMAPMAPMGQTYAMAGKKLSLEDVVNNLGESFQARLMRMIDERGMSDPEVYKRANIDRKLFSKIRCSENYIPKKKTIVALAIALRLNLDDTRDLLASAGLVLANNSKSDLIVTFCIENEIYDIFEVNALLFQFQQPILG